MTERAPRRRYVRRSSGTPGPNEPPPDVPLEERRRQQEQLDQERRLATLREIWRYNRLRARRAGA